jgi:hypothetical protein
MSAPTLPLPVWNPEDEAKLDEVTRLVQTMRDRRTNSNSAVYREVDALVETHDHHEMSLAFLKRWILEHRWQLVDILTQGEYRQLLNQPRLPDILNPAHDPVAALGEYATVTIKP